MKRVIEIADCLPQAHNNLATCYVAQKRFDEAEAELRRAIAMKLTINLHAVLSESYLGYVAQVVLPVG
ncbi:MAG: hypothetical protein H0U76_26385 [Ktedonobacteraceae bacterium]|nr:hypothetical protein [Ktedonobacteraceae bacterium]